MGRTSAPAAAGDAARWPALLLAMTTLAGCGLDGLGRPIEATTLCAELARVICAADPACCRVVPEEDGCRARTLDDCHATVGALARDPRLAYVPGRGGAMVDDLEARSASCWEAPVRHDALVSLFEGTGVSTADCTPASLDALELEIAARSCERGLSCRLWLAADGAPRGVCEPRSAANDDACSHPLDCGSGRFCHLPAGWAPGLWGSCQPLRVDGWACGSDLECASGFCGEMGCATRGEDAACSLLAFTDLVRASAPTSYLRLGEAGGTTAEDAAEAGRPGRYTGTITLGETGAIEGDDDGAVTLAGGHVQSARIATIEGFEALTIGAFVRVVDPAVSGPLAELVSEDVGTVAAVALDGRRVVAVWKDPDGATHELRSPRDVLEAGDRHVAVSFDGRRVRLFVDGREIAVAEGAFTARAGVLHVGHHPAQAVAVGADPDVETHLEATVDEVTVHDRALSEATLTRWRAAADAGFAINEFPVFSWLR